MKKLMIKTLFVLGLFLIGGSGQVSAQTSCCASKKGATAEAKACGTADKTATTEAGKTACCASKSSGIAATLKGLFVSNNDEAETTSGCNPSSCRGAKTKFGEAKAITDLRMKLIDLKADMETYKKVEFPERTYSVHGIVGETDEESLEIISTEVKLMETKFVEAFKLDIDEFAVPENKAKQVQYLAQRIDTFQKAL